MSGFSTSETVFNTGLELSGTLTTGSTARAIAKLHFTNNYAPATPLGIRFQAFDLIAQIPETDDPGNIENGVSTIAISGITYVIEEVMREEGILSLALRHQ